MKYLGLFILLLPALVNAQDGEGPILANPDLFDHQTNHAAETKALANSFDSTFVYLTDTLTLPFFDEFSQNKFQQYATNFSGSNVSDTLYYRMLDENLQTPLAPQSEFSDQKTYRSEYDAQADTTILHYYDSVRFIYDDLSSYPPDHIPNYGYPPYNTFDTINDGANTVDTVWVEDPYFQQDSARIFVKSINEPSKLWLNDLAYHNYRFAVAPWTLGVVSFDGLDASGYPYSFGSTNLGTADTLYAKPMDLSIESPGDSLYFSFLLQREGYGDEPEETDSLYLDFYSPVDQEWNRVWRAPGGSESGWEVVHLPVTDPDYFEKGFQFRFMNYGSLAGGIDHFHIDYVNFRALSGYQDTLFKDFAFVYPISSLLKDYTAVPWKHYRNQPNDKMSDEVSITVRNNSELTENNQNGNVDILYEENLEGSFTLNASTLSGGNINYAPRTTYSSLHDFSTGYSYDANLPNDTSAVFNWEASANAQFPNYAENDSTFGEQRFENYYAYDDGTAEKAYGVTGEQGLLAYRFDAYQPDSLVGIKIHFVPSVVDVSGNLFLLSVWEDNNGQPGDLVYEDEFFFPRQPKYTSDRNKFTIYYFKDTMKVAVDETFYIGMRQIDEERLNIGFDKNHDVSDRIFWSVDGGNNWNNASFPGAVMMRPMVTSKMDYLLDIPTYTSSKPATIEAKIFPNPAAESIQVTTSSGTVDRITIFNARGQEVLMSTSLNTPVDVSHLNKGVYFVKLQGDNNQIINKKLIIQ
ncbi:MAG: T9SS type A sorting domain-containing protein [Bacteroidota bacterium]